MQETVGLVIRVDGRQIAIGKQQLEEFAAAGGKAEKATDDLASSSGNLTASQRALAAEGRKAAAAFEEVAADALALDRRVSALRQSYDPLRATMDRTNSELMEAADLYRRGAIAATEYEAAQTALNTRLAMLSRSHMDGGKAAKLQSYELVNLGRQIGDIGTMAALGASPMSILATQGFQVAEVFGVARQRGVGFGAALGQLGGVAAQTVTRFLPVTLAVGAVVGAFALFERAVDKNTEGATTWGQTWQATVNVVGDAIMNGPIGEGLNWLGRMFGATLDAITGAVMSFVDKTVGMFGAAYQLIVQHWRRLPEVFGVLMQATANAVIGRLENMINTGIAGINVLLKAADVDPLGTVLLPRVKAANAELAADFERLAGSIESSFRGSRESLLAKIVAETERLAAAKDGAAEAAGRHERALKAETAAIDEQARAFAELMGRLQTPQERALLQLHADMRVLRQEFDQGGISAEEYREIFDRLWTVQPALVRAVTDEIITLDHSVSRLPTAWEKALEAIEEIEDATRDIRWGFDDIARSIEDRDWASVFGGLMRTLKDVQTLWKSGAEGSKRSAAGAVLSSAGSMVGGTAGSVLGAAGSGLSAAGSIAALGGSIGALAGPIGWAVAGFSLLNGVLADDKARKRAKREQEANDIARARSIAEERAAKRAELEIELLRASGDELGALTRERENELKALDSVSAAIQRQIYALEDWQKTVTAAESAVAQAEADLRRAYDIERDRLLGIIGGVDEARQALIQAHGREKAAIEATINGVVGLIEGLRDFRQELNLNPLAQGSLAQGRGAALAQFQAAAPGDAPGAGRAFLGASMEAARTLLDYQRDRALVARAVDEMAASAEMQLTDAEKQLAALDKQVAGLLAANDNLLSVEQAIRNLETAEQAAAVATAQLAALDAQVGALINLNAGFMSVAQAIDNLASAQQALAAAQAAKPDASAGGAGAAYEAVGFDGYVDRNADLAALYAAGTGMARGRSKTEFGQYHWERYGQAEDRFYRPFANGGMFSGGVVSGPTAFPMGVMGEAGPEAIMPLVNRGGRLGVEAANDGLKEEVRALRQEMAAMRSASERTARATEDSRDVLEGAARGQLSITTEAA